MILKKDIPKLTVSKASQIMDIPARLIKQSCDKFFLNYLFAKIYDCWEIYLPLTAEICWCKTCVFPVFLNSQSETENYRRTSIFSNISKILERCIYNQIYGYFEMVFLEKQCGFRQSPITKNNLVVNSFVLMVKIFRELSEPDGAYGALLTDLKVFYCLHHELFIAILHA